ncbi:ExbD/TolR family protein [Dyella mobilis]|uniref:Biopolymer transporter ExbD n=1 Tax=Dyella mobilis TaxID=1849582 RepID=A0ABS2KL40_9GAMM|nr:biopolymer transporter ExbD [Dyella mobilis]MBM7131804.1 biopolymer transporter ExbD [Dyella mobilis]GLQ96217.1 biopolymer transport protein exbD2 [Dyella mobilis]
MAFSARASHDVIAQINVTPLVDVLLVLLIIFMITAPIVTHKATMDLPQPSLHSTPERVAPIHLSIQADGQMYWNDIPLSIDQLDTQLGITAKLGTQPALEIDAADGVPYDVVAKVLASAKTQGIGRIDVLGVR